MKIWVTGEAGFIARNLSEQYKTSKKYEIVNCLDNSDLDYWRSKQLSSDKEINIFDPVLPKLIEDSEADVIVHAASVEYDDTLVNPTHAIHTNIEGSYNVANIAHKLGIPVIYLSSMGKNINLFSTTKFSGEQIIKHATDEYIIVKPAIVYGKYDVHSHIAKIFSSIKGGSNAVPLDIDAMRTYLYIDDLISALNIIFSNMESLIGDTIEIGSDVIQFSKLFEFLNEELNLCPDCTLLQAEDLMGDIYTNSDYIKSLGWKPKYNIQEGIKKTAQFYNI